MRYGRIRRCEVCERFPNDCKAMHAADVVLARDGLLGTRPVADAAGGSIGSLYHWFPDKESIARRFVFDTFATTPSNRTPSKYRSSPPSPGCPICRVVSGSAMSRYAQPVVQSLTSFPAILLFPSSRWSSSIWASPSPSAPSS